MKEDLELRVRLRVRADLVSAGSGFGTGVAAAGTRLARPGCSTRNLSRDSRTCSYTSLT